MTREQSPQPQPAQRREVVLLLHGMGRTSASFRKMHAHLDRAGYRVIDWGYPSLRQTIDALAGRLGETLAALEADEGVLRIHIVTHSLGGIVTRAALVERVPGKMGRVVMIAPPNRGSNVARRLAPWLGGLMKPMRELSNAAGSGVNRLGVPAGVEIGIIAGDKDGKVMVADTHLPGETDHLVVPARHTFIMNAPIVLEQTLTFLRKGRFATAEPAASAPIN